MLAVVSFLGVLSAPGTRTCGPSGSLIPRFFKTHEEEHTYRAAVHKLLSNTDPEYTEGCRRIFCGEDFTYTHSWHDWYLWWNVYRYTKLEWGSGTYIDIGTNNPTIISSSVFFDKCLGWEGVCIEAQSSYHERIRATRSCKLLPHCLAGKGGATLNMRTFDGSLEERDKDGKLLSKLNGTLVSFGAAGKGSHKEHCVDASEELPRLLPNATAIDFMTVDVDGMEGTILQCFPFDQLNVQAVLVETKLTDLREVDLFFHRHGFANQETFLIQENPVDWTRSRYSDNLYIRRERAVIYPAWQDDKVQCDPLQRNFRGSVCRPWKAWNTNGLEAAKAIKDKWVACEAEHTRKGRRLFFGDSTKMNGRNLQPSTKGTGIVGPDQLPKQSYDNLPKLLKPFGPSIPADRALPRKITPGSWCEVCTNGSASTPRGRDSTWGEWQFKRVLSAAKGKCPDRLLREYFDNARWVGAHTFAKDGGDPEPLDVDEGIVNQFTIASRPQFIEKWKEVQRTRNRKLSEEAMDELMESLLPLIRVAGHEVKMEDLTYHSSGEVLQGSPFGEIHWDVSWSRYPAHPGFNLWYLVKSASDPHGHGNMFLAATDELKGDEQLATKFAIKKKNADGTASYIHTEHFTGRVLKKYNNLRELKPTFSYLNMSAGEVVIMTKRSLHISDQRPVWDGRFKAANEIDRFFMSARVSVRPDWWCNKTTMPFAPGFTDLYYQNGFTINNAQATEMGEPRPETLVEQSLGLPKICGHHQLSAHRHSMMHWA